MKPHEASTSQIHDFRAQFTYLTRVAIHSDFYEKPIFFQKFFIFRKISTWMITIPKDKTGGCLETIFHQKNKKNPDMIFAEGTVFKFLSSTVPSNHILGALFGLRILFKIRRLDTV